MGKSVVKRRIPALLLCAVMIVSMMSQGISAVMKAAPAIPAGTEPGYVETISVPAKEKETETVIEETTETASDVAEQYPAEEIEMQEVSLVNADSGLYYNLGITPRSAGTVLEDWNYNTRILKLTAVPYMGCSFICWTEFYYDEEEGEERERLIQDSDPFSPVYSWYVAASGRTLVANFRKGGEYFIWDAGTYSEKGELEVSPKLESVRPGTEITVKATPFKNYEVVGIEFGYAVEEGFLGSENVEWERISDESTATFKMPSSDVWVRAVFRSTLPHTVKLICDDSNGTVTFSDGSTTKGIVAGTTVTLNVTPAENYRLKLITGVPESYDLRTHTFEMPDQDLEIHATFTELQTYEIQFKFTPSADYGTIVPAYNQETGLLVVAAAPTNSSILFTGWYDENGNFLSDDFIYSFYPDRNMLLELRFTQGYTIYKANMSHGTFELYPERVSPLFTDTKSYYKPGEQVRLIATPDDGYMLKNYYYVYYNDYSAYQSGQSDLMHKLDGDTITMINDSVIVMAAFVVGYDINAASNNDDAGSALGAGKYEQNTSVTLTAQPKAGYEFVNWTENGTEVSTSAEYTFTATKNRDLVANFRKLVNVTVTASNDSYGTVSGGGEYSPGTSVTVTATPATDCVFVNWTKNGTEVSTSASYTFTAQEDVELVANFRQLDNYTVTVVSSNGEYGTVSGGGTVKEGNSVTVVATPSADCYFVNWTKDGVQVSTSATYTFTPEGNVTLTANFEHVQEFTVSVTSSNTAYGTVSGGGKFKTGESATVKATAIGDSIFVNWTKNGVEVSTSAEYTFTVQESVDLVANFRQPDTYTVTVSSSNDAYGSASGSGSYKEGTSVTVTATPAADCVFVNWTKNGEQVSTSASYTFTPDSDVELVANFRLLNSYTITAVSSNNDYGTVSGGGTYKEGAEVTLKATAIGDYMFVNWTVDGSEVSTSAEYKFTASANVTVTANFIKTDIPVGSTFQYTGEDGHTLTYRVIDPIKRTVEVSDGRSAAGSVMIPEKVKNGNGIEFTVVRIGDNAFNESGDSWDNKILNHITIPSTVKSIGKNAFEYCWALGVTLSEGLEVIEDYAFWNCSAIGELELPSTLTTIGEYAFYQCFSIPEITIPASVTNIGDAAFVQCNTLKAFIVDEGNVNFKSIDGVLFRNIEGGRELVSYPTAKEGSKYEIPSDTIVIGSFAFYRNENLQNVTIPDGITSIGEYAFYYCNKLSMELVIPGSVTTIGGDAFEYCSGIPKLTIVGNDLTIGAYAFADADSIAEVTIPGTVKSIGKYCFGWCNNLKKLTILPGVESVSTNIVYYCNNATVYVPSYLGISEFSSATTIVYYPLTYNDTDTQHSITVQPGKYENTYKDNEYYFFGEDDPVVFTVFPALGDGEDVAGLFETEDLSITKNDDGTYSFVMPYSGAVAKAKVCVETSLDVSINGWTYGDEPNQPEVSNVYNPGSGEITFKYYTDENCTTETTPENSGAASSGAVPVYAGDYFVKAELSQIDFYSGAEAVAGFKIDKADIADSAVTPPAAVTGLKHDGEEHTLITAGSVQDGTMVYALTGSGDAAPADGAYSEELPSAIEAGVYVVYYRVKGDRNHNDIVTAKTVTVTVAEMYTVKFENDDGTELQSEKIVEGETPVYKGETPTKDADDQFTYTFTGWSPEITAVTGDVTYTATYSTTVNEYTVTFKDEDGTELQSGTVPYGETPAYTAEMPTKQPDAEFTYFFAGWSPEITPVTGDATYTATYSSTVNDYMVTFADEDGTVLQSGMVKYGETPEYKGETPTKAADAQYTYTFAGWKPEISAVTGEVTYTATYSATVNEYTGEFINEDGVVLQSGMVKYGETPEYKGETPTKAADAQYTYAFAGWSPEIAAVTGDATYTATYGSTVNTYEITFSVNGATETVTAAYGDTITAPADPVVEGNDFTGWFTDAECTVPADLTQPVTGSATFYAGFEGIIYTIEGSAAWSADDMQDINLTVHRNRRDEDTFGLFKGLIFDGEEVDPSFYTAEPGSVKLTVKSELFEEMPSGTYDLVVVFNDGTVTTKVTIEQKSVAPPTGEPVQIAVCATLALTSLAAFLVIARKIRRGKADY